MLLYMTILKEVLLSKYITKIKLHQLILIFYSATKSYETIKAKYDASNCFLLKVNSRSPLAVNSDHLPDPWSQFIDSNSYKDSKISTELDSSKEPPQEIAVEAEEKTSILSNHPLSPTNDNLTSVCINL